MSKSRDIADSAATINYIDGLTSDAQGQIDTATSDIATNASDIATKAPLSNPTFTGTVTATALSGDGSGLTGVDSLPSQTGNNGLFLTTDGSTASWGEAGGGAMELISTTTVSGTPSTIDITSGFSSTYDDYVIYGSGIIVSNSDDGRIRVYKGGSLLTSADYAYFNRNGTNVSSRTSFDIAWGINTGASASGFKINIVSANSSKFSISCFGGYYSSGTGWNHSGSGSFTGIRIYPASGTFTAGTIKLYGIKKS